MIKEKNKTSKPRVEISENSDYLELYIAPYFWKRFIKFGSFHIVTICLSLGPAFFTGYLLNMLFPELETFYIICCQIFAALIFSGLTLLLMHHYRNGFRIRVEGEHFVYFWNNPNKLIGYGKVSSLNLSVVDPKENRNHYEIHFAWDKGFTRWSDRYFEKMEVDMVLEFMERVK